jgi:hypothetical protein
MLMGGVSSFRKKYLIVFNSPLILKAMVLYEDADFTLR